MSLVAAPLFTDVCPAPLDGAAYWARASDGVRIRLGVYCPQDAKGTVLLFPGRTEYIEKYAPAAGDLAQRGFASKNVECPGQGLADRLLDDNRVGHVGLFADYQLDVQAVVKAAETLELPKPYFLLGHSMGACIGLRSLYDGVDVAAAAFTGPMWGIRIAAALRPVAWALGTVMPVIGHGHRLPPGRVLESYVLTAPYEDNLLTSDLEMYEMMRKQLLAHPELELGGPSFLWLREALAETLALSRMPPPDVPADAFVGTNERIVHVGRIEARMRDWPNSALHVIENGEHEVMMEGPSERQTIFDTIANRFDTAA